MPNDVKLLTDEEIEQLFKDELEPAPSPEGTETTVQKGNSNEAKPEIDVTTTQAFAKRLKEGTEKAVAAERESIAKSLGYTSYEEMMNEKTRKMYEDNGLDQKTVAPIVDKLVEEKLQGDPRLKELETLRTRQLQEFAKKELAEIDKLTGGEITQLSQLPKEVIDLWKQTGSLKSAYLQLEGEKLIQKVKSGQLKGSTQHLQNPGQGNLPGAKSKRPLTVEEKRAWKFFNPSVTDEELNKMTKDA